MPVHNEEHDLEPCVRRLHAYLRRELPDDCRITVADKAADQHGAGLDRGPGPGPGRGLEVTVLVLAR